MRNRFFAALAMVLAGLQADAALGPASLSNSWCGKLPGTWLLRDQPADAPPKALILAPDGALSLVGWTGRSGIDWRLERNRLMLRSNRSDRPETLSESLQILLLNRERLTLAADSPFAGYYRRDDRNGEPVYPGTGHIPMLNSDAGETAEIQLAALEPAIRPMRGQYRYLADSARFTDCASGRSYPVAQGGDSLALERAYLEHRGEAGAWLTVGFTGHLGQRARIDAEGSEETVVVDRFDAVWPGEGCGGRTPAPPLEGTEWRLVEIEGRPLTPAESARNPRLRLEPGQLQVLGHAGCNRFFGGYRRSGETGLSFEQIASTRRYCMEGMDLEQAVLGTLAKTAAFRIVDGRLELLDGSGKRLAEFESSEPEASGNK